MNNRGSALILVMVMIIVLTVICSAFLVGVRLHQKFVLREANGIQALYLAESAVEKCIWLLRGNEGRDYLWRPRNEIIELMDGRQAVVSIEPWGGFLRLTVRADYRGRSKILRVLLGERMPPDNRDAITLTNRRSENLVVCGKNRIIGDVTVGKGGVTTDMSHGLSFEGDKRVEGEIHRNATYDMPFFDNRFFQQAIDDFKKNSLSSPDMARELTALKKPSDTRIRRFEEDLTLGTGQDSLFHAIDRLTCRGNLTLEGEITITGPCALIAAGSIVIRNQARMNHCILYADSGITVRDQARISGQLLCPASIQIRDRSTLDYPSVIYCPGIRQNQAIFAQIDILDQASVSGAVILDPVSDSGGRISPGQTAVQVGPNARIAGMIFCRSRTVFHGSVIGTVITESFSFHERVTDYTNWVKDAVFDRTRLPKTYCRPLLFSESPVLDIVDWCKIERSDLLDSDTTG